MTLSDQLSPEHRTRVEVIDARLKEIDFDLSAMDEIVALLAELHAIIETYPVEGGDE
jgi:hypothetical protein